MYSVSPARLHDKINSKTIKQFYQKKHPIKNSWDSQLLSIPPATAFMNEFNGASFPMELEPKLKGFNHTNHMIFVFIAQEEMCSSVNSVLLPSQQNIPKY